MSNTVTDFENSLMETEEDSLDNLSSSHILSVYISADFIGNRFDYSLFHSMKEYIPSREIVKSLIQANKVYAGLDKPLKPSDKIVAPLQVCVDLGVYHKVFHEPLPENIPLDIIFEDNEILVLNKPPFLVIHPGSGNHSGTLVNALLAHCGPIPSLKEPARAGIVHRLDKETSGVMIAAKTMNALSVLSQQFAEHKHERVYHAFVYGLFENKVGRIETVHGRDNRNPTRYKVYDELLPGRRMAVMNYKVIEEFQDAEISLVECTLETGRTHQIRVQMTHLGHPLLGDKTYNQPIRAKMPVDYLNKPVLKGFEEILTRQMLHAKVLSVYHPRTGLKLKWESMYHDDMNQVLTFLRGLNLK